MWLFKCAIAAALVETVFAGVGVARPADWPKVGPFGTAPGKLDFDDRSVAPAGDYGAIDITCRWGERLDYVKVCYHANSGLSCLEHGNPQGGNTEQSRIFIVMHSLYVHVCTASRHRGKVCGLEITHAKGSETFLCGIMSANSNGAEGRGPYNFFDHKTQFHAFLGITEDNGKVIDQIGWSLKPWPRKGSYE